MTTETLEQRLRAIEDRFAILDLEAEYAYAWDMGTPAQWAAVFAEDGVFEMLPVGNTPHVRLAGRAQLEGFCAHVHEQWKGLHYMHPPRLRLDGDRAESVIFFEFRHVLQAGGAQTRQGVTAGYYRTTYMRTAEGWRIQERVEQAVSEALTHFYPGTLPGA